MLLGVRLVNSLGLSGVPFTGYDIGGFAHETSPLLFARWLEIGTFCPFYRGHTMVNSSNAEPWAHGEQVEDISRNYINLRYKLIPYIYSAVYQASQTGIPIARSLVISEPFDDLIYDPRYQNEFLFGDAILVAPVESYKDLIKVYLPKGKWYNFHNHQLHEGEQELHVDCPIEKLPIFIKAGSIIPMQSIIQSTNFEPEDVLEFHIYYGDKNHSFIYYEDDGSSFDYQKGDFYKREVVFNPGKQTINYLGVKGNFPTKFKNIQVYFHGFSDLGNNLKVNDQEVNVIIEELKLLPPISKYDPKGSMTEVVPDKVQMVKFANQDDEITLKW